MKLTTQILSAIFFDAHALTGEHLAEVDLAAAHAEPSAARDGDRAIVKVVLELGEAAIRSR
jgi:hypothetical protein